MFRLTAGRLWWRRHGNTKVVTGTLLGVLEPGLYQIDFPLNRIDL